MNVRQLDGLCIAKTGSSQLDGHRLKRLHRIPFSVDKGNVNRLNSSQLAHAAFQCITDFFAVHQGQFQLRSRRQRTFRHIDFYLDVANGAFRHKGRIRAIDGHQLHITGNNSLFIYKSAIALPAQELDTFLFRSDGQFPQCFADRDNLRISCIGNCSVCLCYLVSDNSIFLAFHFIRNKDLKFRLFFLSHRRSLFF